MFKSRKFISGILVSALAMSATVKAETLDIEITNLSHGIYFTPLLVSAHNSEMHLFQVGENASMELQAMAEGGDISGLVSMTDAAGALNVENPASGLLAPGASVSLSDWDTENQDVLSLVAMLLPTNDGFVGLDAWPIPSAAGRYTLYLQGYDAGTEANDEVLNGDTGGMPGMPGFPANPGANGGTGGSGVTSTEENTTVHVHRGNLGDTDATGGVSDIDSRIHRWLNPIAKVVVTVK